MKDLNDLMQAILDMDATQRKAAEQAAAERTERLGRLDEEKRAIAKSYAARVQSSTQAAAAAAAAANREALSDLESKRAVAGAVLERTAQANRAQWVEALVRRTLERPAGGEA